MTVMVQGTFALGRLVSVLLATKFSPAFMLLCNIVRSILNVRMTSSLPEEASTHKSAMTHSGDVFCQWLTAKNSTDRKPAVCLSRMVNVSRQQHRPRGSDAGKTRCR